MSENNAVGQGKVIGNRNVEMVPLCRALTVSGAIHFLRTLRVAVTNTAKRLLILIFRFEGQDRPMWGAVQLTSEGRVARRLTL
jgi:hypothetical protein